MDYPRFKRRMAFAGLTLVDFAKELKMKRSTLSSQVTGDTPLSKETEKAMEKILSRSLKEQGLAPV